MIEMDALLQRLTLFTNLYCEFRVLFAIRFVFIKMHCIVFLKFSAFLKYLVSLGVDSIIYYGIKIKIIIRTLNRGENGMGTLCFPCGYSWSWQIYV